MLKAVKLGLIKEYKGIAIELWQLPRVGFLYGALIDGHYEFSDIRRLKTEITKSHLILPNKP